MQDYRRQLIELAVAAQALRFGEFTLKSGRLSPYFFNAGAFDTGAALSRLGECYAAALVDSGAVFDMLFGPAYKGIPLATAAAIALDRHHGLDVPWAFNRKEAKDHGEGGETVGAPLSGRVMIVDDVISAGTAIRDSIEVIRRAGAKPAGVIIALDRQERGTGERSAVEEIESSEKLPVVSIARLDDLVDWLAHQPGRELERNAMQAYRKRYGT